MLLFLLITFSTFELKAQKAERIGADSIEGVYIPKNLYESLELINSFWDDSTKRKVSEWTEDEFVTNAHFGFGRWMRNSWGLWGGSRLSLYFNKLGVYHPEDMSGIILTSYHRNLVGKEIELEKQSPVLDASLSNPEIDQIDKTDPILCKSGVLSAKNYVQEIRI